jgi:hypothetical protein
MMVYNESVNRTLEEQHEYELALTEANEADVSASMLSKKALEHRS